MEDLFLVAAVTDMVCELQEVDGFDEWWYAIDSEVQERIENNLRERIRTTMKIFKVKA